MNAMFKATGGFLNDVRRDLSRPHKYAAERVGFISAGMGGADCAKAFRLRGEREGQSHPNRAGLPPANGRRLRRRRVCRCDDGSRGNSQGPEHRITRTGWHVPRPYAPSWRAPILQPHRSARAAEVRSRLFQGSSGNATWRDSA